MNKFGVSNGVHVNGVKLLPHQLLNIVDWDKRKILEYPISQIKCICPHRPDFPKPILKTSEDDDIHFCITWTKISLACIAYLENEHDSEDDIIVEYPAESCIIPQRKEPFIGKGNTTFITGAYEYDKSRYQNINVVTWPEYWFSGLALPDRIIVKPADVMPKKLFVCLNNKIRQHRDVVMDEFIKEGVITPNQNRLESSTGNYSYVCRDYYLDNPVSAKLENVIQLLNSTEEHYEPCLIDIVVESDCIPNSIRWTEKTMRAIYAEKPFFILSQKHANKKLFDAYGFKPYDFIDYNFDELDTMEERARHVAKQISELSLDDIPMLWQQTRETAKWNRERLFDIVETMKLPKIYEKVYEQAKSELFYRLKDRAKNLRHKTLDDLE